MEHIENLIHRAIPPNLKEPLPLLLTEAVQHLLQARLFRLLNRPLGWVALAGAVLLTGFWPSMAVPLWEGVFVGFVLTLTAYLVWYARFIHRNGRDGTLCPFCTSRMWQFCCLRCLEPVPPLAFMARGALLSQCPYCELRLSSRGGTLLAWCSTCNRTESHPHLFYGKPTHLMVWFTEQLPASYGGHWLEVRRCGDTRRLAYHRADPFSTSLLFVVLHHQDRLDFDPHVIERCRMLLMPRSLPAVQKEELRAKFSKWVLVEEV